ncbi:MAG: CTP synthase [Parcubacteria group bacterium]|nr:CTP synthase [Parcubacteria group bacterium]
MTKYIFVTGGVISGLGKGITSASIGLLLKNKGYKVANVKCEMYVNIDAGTIRPTEHGEVFVTEDGVETDQDIGNYERFLNHDNHAENFITTGQIYQTVIRKERNFEYEGEDVEVVPHVPEEIIRRLKAAGKDPEIDFVISEFGGTVGEYQGVLFLEAARMMEVKNPENVVHIHVSYLPTPKTIGEMKTKPVQYSVRTLNAAGIKPHFVVGRAEYPLDDKRKEKLSQFCSVPADHVISNHDVESAYEVPMVLAKQKLGEKILKQFGLPSEKKASQPKDLLKEWGELVKTIKSVKKEIKIGIVGKYFATGEFTLEDSYISVIEAIKHACWHHKVKPVVQWINAEVYEKDAKKVKELDEYDGIIIPGGYGKRGTEGKIKALEYARENKIPFLGLCYGLQMAVIEFARNVCDLKGANSVEIDPQTPHPVINLLPEQEKLIKEKKYGGTNRLGAYPCVLEKGSIAHKAYGTDKISERHRHRYEFNNEYRDQLTKAGLQIGGIYEKWDLVEIIELPDHPFFVGTQFHPEFQSRPLDPHPLFKEFIGAAKGK